MLLDDSYSMSEKLGTETAFDQAKSAIQRLGASAVRTREPQTFTLLRLSRCGGRYGGTRPDFQKEAVDADFAQRLGETLESIQVSQTAAEPLPALDAVQQQLLGEDAGERRIVYLFSDFRTRQWDKPDDLKKRFAQLDEKHAEVRLIDCVQESGRPNLAIAALEPEEDIRAAGVQWRMQVTVQNYGPAAVRNVPVYWSADGKPGGTATIDAIPPGRSAQKEFYVNFAVAGEHTIQANLNADAVTIDNQRYAVVDLPVATPVLLVDGDRAARNAKRIADVLTARKGIQPEIVTRDYLSAPKRPLAEFAMICVTNCGKIERSGVEALEEYVKAGGGVFFATGPVDPRRVRDPGPVSQRQGVVPRALGRRGTAGGRSAGQHSRRAVRGALRLPQHGPPGGEPVEDLREAVFCRGDRLECQARSGRAGDHAAPQRCAAAGGKGFRPWPGAGLPVDHLGQVEQLARR